jgi:hypothetical protein
MTILRYLSQNREHGAQLPYQDHIYPDYHPRITSLVAVVFTALSFCRIILHFLFWPILQLDKSFIGGSYDQVSLRLMFAHLIT